MTQPTLPVIPGEHGETRNPGGQAVTSSRRSVRMATVAVRTAHATVFVLPASEVLYQVFKAFVSFCRCGEFPSPPRDTGEYIEVSHILKCVEEPAKPFRDVADLSCPNQDNCLKASETERNAFLG